MKTIENTGLPGAAERPKWFPRVVQEDGAPAVRQLMFPELVEVNLFSITESVMEARRNWQGKYLTRPDSSRWNFAWGLYLVYWPQLRTHILLNSYARENKRIFFPIFSVFGVEYLHDFSADFRFYFQSTWFSSSFMIQRREYWKLTSFRAFCLFWNLPTTSGSRDISVQRRDSFREFFPP